MEAKKNSSAPVVFGVVIAVVLGLAIGLFLLLSNGQPAKPTAPKTEVKKEEPKKTEPKPAVTEAPQAKVMGVHDVIRGDSLWWISDKWYKDPVLWPSIFEINKGIIKDPDLIYPGQKFDIPALAGNTTQLSPEDYALLSQGYLEAYRVYKEKGKTDAEDYRKVGDKMGEKAKK